MAALTKSRDTVSVLYHTPRYALGVAAGAKPYQGGMVAKNASGYLEPASSKPSLAILGRLASDDFDNTSGSDGAKILEIDSGIFLWANAGVTDADIGKFCYAVDDQTVSMTGLGRSIAGIVRDVTAEGVWVDQVSTIGYAISGALPIAWETQGTWFIDPDNGSDDSAGGTEETAIASLEELQRRLSGRTIAIPITVSILADEITGNLNLACHFIEDGYVIVKGRTTVLAEGTVTATQEWDPSTTTPGWIEAIDIPGTWADYIGKLVRFPDRDPVLEEAGAACFVMKDLGTGNKRARVSARQIYEAPFGILEPQVGEEFEICSVTKLNGSINVNSTKGKTPGGFVAVIWIDADPTDATFDGLVSEGGVTFFLQCYARGYDSGSRGAAVETSFDTCFLDGYRFTAASGTCYVDFGSVVSTLNIAPSAKNGGTLQMDHVSAQGAALFDTQSLGNVQITANSWGSVHDCDVGGQFQPHSVGYFEGQFWGTNIDDSLLLMDKTSSLVMQGDLAATGTLSIPVSVGGVSRSLVQANAGHVTADGTRIVIE